MFTDVSYPLTEAQHGIMLEWIQHPGLTQYNVNIYYKCAASLDADRLRTCLQTVINRHDVFFTRIRMEDNQFRQYIDRSEEIVVESFEMNDAGFDRFLDDYVKPFNIFGDCLTRIAVIKTEKHTYIVFDTSHLIFDSVSATMLWDELCSEYEGIARQYDDIPYATAVEKEIQQLKSEAYTLAADYYQRSFEGLSMTKIPSRHPEAVGRFRDIALDMAKQEIERYCDAVGQTPNVVFMAAYAIALSAFSGEQKVAFYSVNHGRTDREAKKSYGMFVKTVPFQGNLTDEEMTVTDFIRDFRSQMMSNIRHGLFPFTHFCRNLHCRPEHSFNFHVIQRNVAIGGEPAMMQQFFRGGTLDSISTQVWDLGDSYQITIDYNDQMYSRWLMQQFADTMCDIVLDIIAKPDACLKDLSLVSTERAAEILSLGKGDPLPSAAPYEHHFVDMFSRQVSLNPHAVAVVDCQGSMSYAELDEQSSRLAAVLVSEANVKVNDVVAIMLPRTNDFMVAVLAAMKAGAIYVPISMDYPAHRVEYILHDSQSKLLINQDYLLSARNKLQSSNFKDQSSNFKVQSSKFKVQSSKFSYIIYTSGSTGNPKGVLISQKALCSFIRTCQYTYDLSPADRILCHGTFTFDASVEDLFPILATGGQSHILKEELRTDVTAIRNYIIEHGITGGNYTTAFGEILLTAYPDLPLRYVTLGGERLDKVPEGLTCRFFNSYGPTEFTVDATFWEHQPSNLKSQISNLKSQTSNFKVQTSNSTVPPIGRPVNDCMALVLDSQKRLMPLGCPGYLYLAGPQIASGYWNDSKTTAEAFTPCPYADTTFQSSKFKVQSSKFMYFTGDIVCWNEDGNLEYIGRKDEQMKLNGYRIEMGEVAAALMKVEGIRQVHVGIVNKLQTSCVPSVASVQRSSAKFKVQISNLKSPLGRRTLATNGTQETSTLKSQTSKALCAWYTSNAEIDKQAIRSSLARLLPKYMIPQHFIHLENFPVTPNGKIDTNALPQTPTIKVQSSKFKVQSSPSFAPPSCEGERIVADIVAELLGVEGVSVTDDLFSDLGLSSLEATTLAFRANAKGMFFNVTDLYEKRTIRSVVCNCVGRTAYYWYDGYDPAKPVIILICGYVYLHPLYDNIAQFFKDFYSIYVIDAFHENFMWKKHVSCDILTDEYLEAYKRDILGKNVYFIMGTCFGADVAIPFCEKIQSRLGVTHRMLAFDPIYDRRPLTDPVPYENNPTDAILEQYRISRELGSTIPIPTYQGPMIIVTPTDTSDKKYVEYDDKLSPEELKQVERFIQENDRLWDRHFPQVPKYKVPGDHYSFLETANMPQIQAIINKHWPL